MADLHILRDHTLGLAAARKVAVKWAEHAQTEFGMTCTYAEGKTGDEVCFERSGVTGILSVTKAQFEVKAQLGFFMGAFKSVIEAEITKNLDDLLKTAPAAKATGVKKK